jgi:hypothetical protein
MASAIFPCLQTKYHVRIISELGHFPTIVALAGIAKSYRRKIKRKLTLIEDGVAHILSRIRMRGWCGRLWRNWLVDLDFIESRQVRVVSSRPPEGYRYLELFLPEHRNFILRTPWLLSFSSSHGQHQHRVSYGFYWSFMAEGDG